MANTNWSINLNNTTNTWTATETVNSVTLSGTFTRPSTGFDQLTVGAATGSVGVAPTVGSIFYSLEVPGLAMMTQPMELTESAMINTVVAGSCPTRNLASNFIFTQWDAGGGNDMTSYWQPAFGTFNWNWQTSTGTVASVYNVRSNAAITNFTAFSVTGTCASGQIPIAGSGDRAGTLYLSSEGGGFFRTNGNKGVFLIPQQPVANVTELTGNYAALLYVNGENGVTGTNGVNGSVTDSAFRIVVNTYATRATGTGVNPGTGVANGTTNVLTITAVNSPTNGFIRGVLTQNGNSGLVTCAMYLTSRNFLFCTGQDPDQNSYPINLLMVSDYKTFSRSNGPVYEGYLQYELAEAKDAARPGAVYLLTGSTPIINGQAHNTTSVIRYLSDGSYDSTFNVGVQAAQGLAPATDATYAGDVYIGAGTTYVGRFRTDGSNDTTFALAGTGLSAQANTIVLPADGYNGRAIYAAGQFTTINGTSQAGIARFFTNGTLDTSFSVGVGAGNYSGGLTATMAAAIDTPNLGKVYMGGNFQTLGPTVVNYLVRLFTNGAIDTSFAVGTSIAGGTTTIYTIAPAIDTPNLGKIYVGGNFTSYNGATMHYIFRANSDGSRDTSFAIGSGFNSRILTIDPAVDPANLGKIYVGGQFVGSYNGVTTGGMARLNTNGTLDTTFAIGVGFQSAFGNQTVTSILPWSDPSQLGNILVTANDATFNYKVVSFGPLSLASDGSLNGNWSGQVPRGIVNGNILTLAAPAASIYAGRPYVAGSFSIYNGNSVNNVVRLTMTGAVDESFAMTGTGLNTNVYALAAPIDTPDTGKMYIGGNFTLMNGATQNRIVRVNYDGSADTTFAVPNAGFNVVVNQIAPAVDTPNLASIYVGGNFTSYGTATAQNGVVRLLSNGSLDTTFTAALDTSGVVALTPAIDTPNLGKVYVGGNFITDGAATVNYIARLNTNGALDAAFAPAGTGLNGVVNAIAIAVDTPNYGKVYVGGAFTQYNGNTTWKYLLRLLTDGTLDTTFVRSATVNGIVTTLLCPSDSQNLGKVMYGGNMYNFTRLLTNGASDTTFGNSGIMSIDGLPVYGFYPATDSASIGKVYMVGNGNFALVPTYWNSVGRMTAAGQAD